METGLTQEALLNGLWIAVAVLLLILLYHLLFIVVDFRKIARRLENITNECEEMIRTPMIMAESVASTVMELIGEWIQSEKTPKKKQSSARKK